jgi:CheY-like chemotaxis protein
VRTAADGPSARSRCRTFQPQVALLDLGLPVMDGYELSSGCGRSAHRSHGGGHRLRPGNRSSMTAAGFAAHFVKPVELEELKATLDGC